MFSGQDLSTGPSTLPVGVWVDSPISLLSSEALERAIIVSCLDHYGGFQSVSLLPCSLASSESQILSFHLEPPVPLHVTPSKSHNPCNDPQGSAMGPHFLSKPYRYLYFLLLSVSLECGHPSSTLKPLNFVILLPGMHFLLISQSSTSAFYSCPHWSPPQRG